MPLDQTKLARQTVDMLLEAGEDDLDWEPEATDPDDSLPSGALDEIAAQERRRKLTRDVKRAFKGAFQQPYCEEGDYYYVEARGEGNIIPAFVHNPGDPPTEPEGAETDAEHDRQQEEYQAELSDYLKGFEAYVEFGEPESVEKKHGWIYWTSAPGYTDMSPYNAAETEEEALEQLIEYYGDSSNFENDDTKDEDDE